MEKVLVYLQEFYKFLRSALKDMMIFPGKNLIPVFKWVALLCAISFVSSIFRLPTLISWQGSLFALIVLGIVLLISGLQDKLFTGGDTDDGEQIEVSSSIGATELHEESSACRGEGESSSR